MKSKEKILIIGNSHHRISMGEAKPIEEGALHATVTCSAVAMRN